MLGHVDDSQKQFFVTLETPKLRKIFQERIPIPFKKWYFRNARNRTSEIVDVLETARADKNAADPSDMFWKSRMRHEYLSKTMNCKFGVEYEINIYQKTWIWDQSLSKNMKSKFGIENWINIFKKTWTGNVVISDEMKLNNWMILFSLKGS